MIDRVNSTLPAPTIVTFATAGNASIAVGPGGSS
jgi:hypothetical protein